MGMSVYYWLPPALVLVGLALLLVLLLRLLSAARRFIAVRGLVAGTLSGKAEVLRVRGAALRDALPWRRKERVRALAPSPGSIEALGR